MMISMRYRYHCQSFDRIAQILNIQLLTIKTMKLHSLLLLPAIIGSAIVPILSISLPAQSVPDLLPDQTIDFGTQPQSSQQPFRDAPLGFTVPEGQIHYRITPAATSPFTISPNNGFVVGNNNRNVLVAVNLEKLRPSGVHQQLITVKSGGKIIKTVLLKVYIPAAVVPGQNPDRPTPSNPAKS
jgi:hypothetical protein